MNFGLSGRRASSRKVSGDHRKGHRQSRGFRLKTQPERAHNFQDGIEGRITVLRQCFVQSVSTDACIARELHHAAGPRNCAESSG